MTFKKIKQILSNQSENSDEPQMYQNILIQFNETIEVVATVRAFCFNEEELRNLHLTAIKVTEPKKLPKDLSFSEAK